MRVAEAVDGHSELAVDCLTEPMCQTRAGESGSWFGIAPNKPKALWTRLIASIARYGGSYHFP
jgi:hypothetical protein